MSRIIWKAAAGLLLLALLNPAPAQDSQSKRIITGKRIVSPSFQLEVLVDGRPLSEYYSRGQAYVEAREGAEYELRLRNSSPDRVAVALSVDGLSSIDARQTSAWNSSKWVIEPYESITISGWQMNTEQARRFYFTNERDSYAAKLGLRTDLGLISAVFFRERSRPMPITKSRPQTSAEPSLRAEAMGRAEDRAATGIGRSVENEVCLIDMELEPRPVAELEVRYEWRHGSHGFTCGSNPRCRAGDRRDN